VITTNDHVEAILNGLSEECDGFVIVVLSHVDSYNIEEIESFLLSQ